MPVPISVAEPRQLVAEGRDAVVFFRALFREMGLAGVQVQDYGGISELARFLKALRNMSGFQEKVVSLGIVRDAEASGTSAFQSACSALRNADLPVPQEPITRVGGNPTVSIFILPDCVNSGMFETLCLKAISGDPAMSCIVEYFSCLQRQGLEMPLGTMHKAQLHAFLASRRKPDLQLGEAAEANYLRLDSPVFDQLKQFLRNL